MIDSTLFPSEFVLPNYQNSTIANVAPTAANLLGASFSGLPTLPDPYWRPLAGNVQRVVVFLIDALGWNIIQKEQTRLAPLLDEATVIKQITSVHPSTTVNALSSVWTGTAPSQHGLLSLRLFFPEFASLGYMLSLSPNFYSIPDSLVRAGLDVETFLATPGFGEQMTAQGVEVHAFKGREIVDSALSRMHGRGITKDHGAITVADMLIQSRKQLESNLDVRQYHYLYWPTVDSLSHVRGPFSETVAAETETIFTQIKKYFVDGLSPTARDGTVLILMADHGQTFLPQEQQIHLADHPHLTKMLTMRNAGEPRCAILYAKQGQVNAVVDYVNNEIGELAFALKSDEALDSGLFGPPPFAPQSRDRLGDVVVLMRQGATWLNPEEVEKAQILKGRHGCLSADEMEVPFIGFRF